MPIENVNFQNLISTEEFIDNGLCSYIDQIDMQNFLVKCTAPHILYRGFNYNTPLIHPEWLNFMLSIPRDFRKDEHLFTKILYYQNPAYFDLPVKMNYGQSINVSSMKIKFNKTKYLIKKQINKVKPLFLDQTINYINFTNGIRNRADIKKIIFTCIEDLKKRKIFSEADIDQIWNMHISKHKNFTYELILLSSLEINLKVMEDGKNDAVR